jgi:hypothetical protein
MKKQFSSVRSTPTSKEKSKVIKTENDLNIPPQRILRIHPILNKLYNVETGLVFKSEEEKIVIGFVEEDTPDIIQPLNEETRRLCDKYCYKYETLLKKEIKDEEVSNESNS